ncbi:hypothetical protein BA723_04855 [Helicobacter sp. CLO-3]|uniref:polyprenyl synthetase family protein n=1 Tax=Helicobacter sp. CLO-3 TaxID=211 RepID=UPI000804C138|nr:polyprenyl synthetase family protein [Helicobacter sp. CLO-3]OBV29613.1 hypothetical protein BA723_04855 [Helicobacter sp. CLO-3]
MKQDKKQSISSKAESSANAPMLDSSAQLLGADFSKKDLSQMDFAKAVFSKLDSAKLDFSKLDFKEFSAQVLESIKSRCSEWVAESKHANTIEMYSKINHGKMMRSKLVLSILAPTLTPSSAPALFADSALESKIPESKRAESKISESKSPESKRADSTKSTDSAKSTDSTAPASQLLHAKLSKIIDLCAIIELIQCASLLHDDVIDDASTRRGKPSINASFGSKNAIMLGDVLYSSAYVKLCDFAPEIAKTIADSVSQLARGEIDDVFCGGNFQPDLEVYYRILSDKTASLIAASAKAAALLGGLDSSIYHAYGYNLGMAFQIVDDILDITQDASTLGKPAMNDIREGKSTLPYILLYHTLKSDEREVFLRAFMKADEESIATIKSMLLDSDSIARAKDIAKDFIHKATQAIERENNARLMQIATSVIERSF